ncbi:MAG TPA: DUF3160 domain-containing protein [bacterium (Candidatus Stahlbacteria)]|nr:DUF3160 domain-containing protein [Candidatus Stahlbacteria bacterium]
MKYLILFFSAIISCHHAVAKNEVKVTPSNFKQFYDLYKNLDQHGEPIFVSIDCIIHTFHLLYNFSLREIENNRFMPKLDTLLDIMIKETNSLPERLADHKNRNLAFFSVAKKLLRPEYSVVPSVKGLVAQELELIKRHKGFSRSPIFEVDEDYSQFVPRGHYTRTERLKYYFLAMSYLGRMGYYIKPRNRSLALSHITRALLIILALKGEAYRLWNEIYQITNTYVGRSDDLGPPDFLSLLKDSFPNFSPIEIIEDETMLQRFAKIAADLRRPKIISTFTRDDEDVFLSSLAFKFMGQRFIPDSYVFQNLVYNKVGTRVNPRLFPRGLDLAAVLGSERALKILINHYHEDKYLNYTKQLTNLQKEFKTLPESQWQENIYWGWIALIRDLLNPSTSGPRIFRTAAWVDKTLATALAFWAELRHDAILYAKQSYTVSIVSIREPREKQVYLEPRSNIYKQLKTLTTSLPVDLLSTEIRARIENYQELLDRCIKISDSELAGEPISQDDKLYLYGIGSILEFQSQIPSQKIGMAEADRTVEMIADVHTDVNTKQSLEVGIGKIDRIEITIEGKRYVGGIFSYYEFLHPIFDRLTDEKWQKMTKPERPEWQRGYLSF